MARVRPARRFLMSYTARRRGRATFDHGAFAARLQARSGITKVPHMETTYEVVTGVDVDADDLADHISELAQDFSDGPGRVALHIYITQVTGSSINSRYDI